MEQHIFTSEGVGYLHDDLVGVDLDIRLADSAQQRHKCDLALLPAVYVLGDFPQRGSH
ncbi:hypothetical protein SDC9_204836 [bioreactor metagenome]|uniref:Uncharacterized protein n=1 Tax=bioreactor metagenome TaxID=1076179 RepID=A0A645J205_9ZZZZ